MIELEKRKKQRGALFGGALRCAGLAAAALSANAMGEFTPSAPAYAPPLGLNVNLGYADLAGGGSGGGYNYSVDASFAAPFSYVGSGGSLSAVAGSLLMEATADLTNPADWSYAFAGVTQYFTVSDATDVVLEWDFTNGYGNLDGEFGRAWVFEYGGGFLAQEISGSGSLNLTLSAGSEYFFVGRAGTLGGGAFARLSIVPAPGALSLLGLGLVTARRRRRE